jgi:hypothetical protein
LADGREQGNKEREERQRRERGKEGG